MRIERVEAHVFGPLKGETLELAPGMTVIHGPNEAGKSSWHAALYAGLCGRRRGPGAGTRADRAFAERHRPWHSERWEVGLVAALAGGRRVELRHDLAGGVDCRATDLALGRDVSDEIMFEGAPDGARWLGLNRRTLPATVFVRQADVLGVLEAPEQLQEALQRAAATGGTDATAEHALQRIATFRRERIGLDRRNSTKPLRRSVEAVEAAEAAVRDARAAHGEYVQLVAERDGAMHEAAAARARLEAARAERERAEVETLRLRVERAEALAGQVGQGPPPEPADDDALAERVSAALAAHDARPAAPQPLRGEDAATLQAALDALPAMPEGDREPARAVVEAHQAWAEARHTARIHEHSRPAGRPRPATGGLGAGDLRSLADTLERGVPEVDPGLRAEAERLRSASGGSAGGATALLVLGAVLLALGASAALAGLTGAGGLAPVGAGLALLGAVLAGGGLAVRRRGGRGASAAEVAAVETRLALAEERHEEAVRAREAARTRVETAALRADPAALRALAQEVEVADGQAERRASWQAQTGTLADAAAEAATRLWEALRARGEMLADTPDPGMAFDAYEHGCRRRAEQAARAARREDLRARLEARRAAEADVEDRLDRRRQASEALDAAARAAGEQTGGDPDELAARLRRWQERRAVRRRELQDRREAWLELQHLLDGRPLDALREELDQRRTALPGAPGDPRAAPPGTVPLAELEAAAAAADLQAAHLEGRVADRQQDLPGVAEAEEGFARAQQQLCGLRALDATLDRTRRFLEDARERVHRDIAPQLKAAVESRLATVTAGRYDQVAVDPATLHVQVRAAGAPWRPATALSHGTAEQVYLLLRLAMAEHLVTGAETAPLVLDDVTVQSDPARTEAFLGLLHETSRDRQVIVFSQEDAVLEWATRTLRGPQDALVRLERIGVAL